MKKNVAALAAPLLFSLGVAAGPVLADDGNRPFRVFTDRDVDTFAVLQKGVRFPEGIAANPANGDIYVATFDGGGNNKLQRFDRHGRLLASRDFGAEALLGLIFDPVQNKVYICNARALVLPGATPPRSKIQRISASFNSTTPIEDVADIPFVPGAPGTRKEGNPDGSVDTINFGFGGTRAAPNALEFNKQGDLFISDSFQGAIFRIMNVRTCVNPCFVDTFVQDPILATAGFPPFGANGLAFNDDEQHPALFVANTGDDRVLKLDLGTMKFSVFAESINGADGLVFDKRSGLLWVCANQADEVIALNANGKPVARLGEFRGINRDGTPDGLLFPASPVIVGNEIFVTNLAIALRGVPGNEPEEDVKLWTISRMRLPDRDKD
jgi:DNA-binding beta-propeller fold protein YncE